MLASKHPEEQKRLSCLRSLGVLDTEQDPKFDDITQLAAYLCDAPTALVSLVDDDRQWFKSRIGFQPEQTDLDSSVCAHTILGPDPLVISDLSQDPRTSENPLVMGETGVRFYAGVPLVGKAGLPYGALCVLDTRPRILTDVQLENLKRLARQVVGLLEAELLLREKEDALRQAQILKEEIDHRVGNSLQQVVTLLRLQARAQANVNAASVEVIEDAQRRVEAIASFHTRLGRLSSGNTVDLAELVDGLVEDLSQSIPPHVRVHHEAESGVIMARLALAVATMVNEFIANSVKHAFPDGRTGQIHIAAKWSEDSLTIELRDDGVGIDSTGTGSRGSGLGMKVIEAAAMTLGAEMTPLPGPGTGMRLVCPVNALRLATDRVA